MLVVAFEDRTADVEPVVSMSVLVAPSVVPCAVESKAGCEVPACVDSGVFSVSLTVVSAGVVCINVMSSPCVVTLASVVSRTVVASCAVVFPGVV